MEAGIQLHLPTFKDYPLPQLLGLGRLAQSGGFEQVPDPYAYDLEDRLIASYRQWCEEVSRTIPEPPDLRRGVGERNFRSEVKAQ